VAHHLQNPGKSATIFENLLLFFFLKIDKNYLLSVPKTHNFVKEFPRKFQVAARSGFHPLLSG
jgi:uncharacterized membrane protein